MALPQKSQKMIEAEDHFTDLTTQSYPATPSFQSEEVAYDDVTALSNILAELGEGDAGGGFVTVFRETIDASGKKPDEYLERYAASEFSLDNLKARWGAGKYKISVYQDGRILTRKVITIAKDPNAISQPMMTAPAVDLTPILAAIQKSNEGVVAGIMALAQSMQKTGPSRTEMLSEMQIMREMFTPAPSQQPVNYNPVEMMKLGMEMAQSGAGGGDSNNAWVSKVLEVFGPALVPALTNAVTEKAAPVRSPPAALPAPAIRPATLETQSEDSPVNGLIYNYLNMLKRAASQNAPVEEYADSILTMVPASSVGELEALLSPADWREQMRKKTTAVEEFPVWFTALRDTLLAFIEEDKGQAVEVGTHLTSVGSGDSVSIHENATATDSPNPPGDPASPA